MNGEAQQLAEASPGLTQSLRVPRYGRPGRGPKAMVEAALHADEVPATRVAQALHERLAALDATGRRRTDRRAALRGRGPSPRARGTCAEAADVIADLVDVETGVVAPPCTQPAGVRYARSATRWATPGQRVAKVAGTTLARAGKLPSPWKPRVRRRCCHAAVARSS